MKIRTSLIAALVLILMVPMSAGAKDKKKKSERGMLESMQSVPCGVKQGGINGLGSIFGSVGIEHVNSNEKLCPQYLLRTDEMEYHIRPVDMKHAVLLPIGHEGEFKIKKDKLFLKVRDEDKKTRAYQVVAMQPVNSGSQVESTRYRSTDRTTDSKSIDSKPDSRSVDSRSIERSDSRSIEKSNKTAEQLAQRPPQ